MALTDESWARDSAVLQLLGRLLQEPWGDHSVLVNELLRGGPLCDVHVYGLVVQAASKAGKQLLAASARSKGFALHCWLYHLLGGAGGSKLASPPSAKVDEKGGSTTAALCTSATRLHAKYFDKLRALTDRRRTITDAEAVARDLPNKSRLV